MNQVQAVSADDQNVVEFSESPGRRLRVLRQSRGIEIERIAAQLHLRVAAVEALEQDRYPDLPGPVFVAGYLRNYARLLGLDAEPLIGAFRAAHPDPEPVGLRVSPLPRQEIGSGHILVRLISLHNWRFSCKDAQQTFSQLLLNLDSGLLRLPKNANRDAEKYLAQGCAPLRHTTRQGTRTVSWYHGPLVPASNRAELPREAVRASDQLVRFNRELGFFDVSYAAAWELGRLLALQSKTFSAALFGWKRSQVQGLQAQAFRGKKDGGVDSTSQAVGLPSSVKEWFERIQLLEGIPLNYLIPDERMLPPAAIRFFSVDWYWLECLQTGAFSLGRPTKWDECLLTALPEPSRKTSGFVLRSDVVAGWPGLVVSVETPAKLLRMGRLSDDVLICLFDGEPGAVNFHLKPETLHFELGKARLPIEKIPWQREAACRVIATEKLAIHALKTDSPAQFAAKMLADGDDVQLMAWQKKTDG